MENTDTCGILKIEVKEAFLQALLIDKAYKSRHFENVLLFLLEENREDFYILSNYEVMRAVLTKNKGGKVAEKVKYINDKYKDNKWLKLLIDITKNLKIHNISALIKNTKKDCTNHFTKLKEKKESTFPRRKKLSRLIHYSMMLDVNSWSVKNKDFIGINVDKEMVYLSFKHEYLLKIVGNLNKIQNIKIVYSNGEISLHILYMKNWTLKTNENEKLAGMDAGINNLAALFINDSVSKSVIYSGENDIDYNVKSNRFIGKIQTSISKEVETYKLCKGKWYPETYTEKGIYLKKYVNFLFEKRHKHFYNEFHKISRRIVELLLKTGVSKLIISYNLGEMKNKGGLTMGKAAQKFFQIPIVKLIKYVEMKCNEVGIKIEIIDESYTSKTSCLSDDVNNPKPDNELNAVRSKRGLLTDKKLHQRYNADLGGAANHVKKYDPTVNYDYLHTHMFKLCNPVKITDDYDFTKYLKTL